MRYERVWCAIGVWCIVGALASTIWLLLLNCKKMSSAPHSPHIHKHNLPPGLESNNIFLIKDLYVPGHSVVHAELCEDLGSKLQLLVLVASALEHSAKRDAVRLTWGHFGHRSDVAMAFVLGQHKHHDEALNAALEAEEALYGDMIVGNSVDTYWNLTLKTLSMLEWVSKYCPLAPRLLKADDDSFINIPLLLDYLAAPGRANATKTIWGRVSGANPWWTNGPAYVLSGDCVPLLLAAAPDNPYNQGEDVFFTGVLAEAANITLQHAEEFYNQRIPAFPCTIQRGFSLHGVRPHEQFSLWQDLLDDRTKAKCNNNRTKPDISSLPSPTTKTENFSANNKVISHE